MNVKVIASLFMVLIVLFTGSASNVHAEGELSEKIKVESEKTSTGDESSSLYTEIKDSSDRFDATSKLEQLKELSVKLVFLWVVIAGILFFIGVRRIAATMLGFGFIGFIFMNYPKEITALFMEGAEYVSSLLK